MRRQDNNLKGTFTLELSAHFLLIKHNIYNCTNTTGIIDDIVFGVGILNFSFDFERKNIFPLSGVGIIFFGSSEKNQFDKPYSHSSHGVHIAQFSSSFV